MNILFLILQLFPLLLTTIQQIEGAVQIAKAGPAKLQLVTNVVKSAYKFDTAKPTLAQEQMIPLVQSVTADIVSYYNTVGVFKKSS